MNNSKNEIIKYRFERAIETIEEAKLLATQNHWNTVANRLYYACFYALIGLFAYKNITTKSHDGVRIILNKEFIFSGILPNYFGQFYNEIFNKRQESDYKDIKRFKKDEIEPLIERAEDFIKAIELLVNTTE